MGRLPATLAALALMASTAWAGEVLLGKLQMTGGLSISNRNTAAPFMVPSNAKISIQCVEDAYVMTDVSACDAGNCVLLGAGMLLPTSVNSSKTFAYTQADGGPGTYSGGWVAAAPASGTTATCRVFSRTGTE